MLTKVCQIDWFNKTRLVPILFLFLFFLFSFFLQEACAKKGCLALKQNMTEPKKKKEKKSKRKQRKRKDKSIELEAFFLTALWALTTKKKAKDHDHGKVYLQGSKAGMDRSWLLHSF